MDKHEERKYFVDSIFIRIIDDFKKAHSLKDVTVETVTREDSGKIKDLKFIYRGKTIVRTHLKFGHWIEVINDYSENWNTAEYDVDEMVKINFKGEPEYKRFLNGIKNNIKRAIPKIDKDIKDRHDANDRQSEILNNLIKNGFQGKHLERNLYSIGVNYKGFDLTVFKETDVEVKIPQEKLKQVLDLIAE
jgi:hypothetical protein